MSYLPMGMERHDSKAVISETASTSLLVLNSADRYQNSTVGPNDTFLTAPLPWNKFLLQRPQQLLGAFAKRLNITEVRFPWAIPNISVLNNSFYLENITTPATTLISIPPSFYTPAEIVAAITSAFTTAVPTVGNRPTITYDAINQRYTITNPVGSTETYSLQCTTESINGFTYSEYTGSPWLLKTLGFTLQQVNNISVLEPGDFITGEPTLSQYTNYVDIVSQRITTYVKVKDGSSSNSTSQNLICRLYADDETSMPYLFDGTGNPVPNTCRPFTIYRQFKCPKSVRWNPDATVDWLDISVLDEYGDLVPLPSLPSKTLGVLADFPGSYPDFQITVLVSED